MFAAEDRGEIPKGTAKEWARETPDIKELPEKVKKKKKRKKMKKTSATTKPPSIPKPKKSEEEKKLERLLKYKTKKKSTKTPMPKKSGDQLGNLQLIIKTLKKEATQLTPKKKNKKAKAVGVEKKLAKAASKNKKAGVKATAAFVTGFMKKIAALPLPQAPMPTGAQSPQPQQMQQPPTLFETPQIEQGMIGAGGQQAPGTSVGIPSGIAQSLKQLLGGGGAV